MGSWGLSQDQGLYVTHSLMSRQEESGVQAMQSYVKSSLRVREIVRITQLECRSIIKSLRDSVIFKS